MLGAVLDTAVGHTTQVVTPRHWRPAAAAAAARPVFRDSEMTTTSSARRHIVLTVNAVLLCSLTVINFFRECPSLPVPITTIIIMNRDKLSKSVFTVVTGHTSIANIKEHEYGGDIFFEITDPAELQYTYRIRPAKTFGSPFVNNHLFVCAPD